MYKKIVNIRIFAISAIVILVAVSFHPALDPFWDYVSFLPEDDFDLFSSFASASELDDIIISSMKPDQDINISELNGIAIDNDDIDTDGDGLYDSVETVLGTDRNNTDSDFDQLNDYDEAINRTDPLNPDSNYDGLADYIEIHNMTADIDGDGIDNVWDVDNDNDGVTDEKDLSPFSKSHVKNTFNFNIKTNGNPTFLNYQIRPKDADHLTLPLQFWDWPEDDQGLMRDLNNSEEDVFILPYLEMSIQTDFRIISKNSEKCLEVSNASEAENATIWQNTYVGNPNQHWYIKSVAEGYVKIQAVHSEKCLEVNNASLDDGAPVFQGTYAGEDYQQWKLEPLGNNSYILLAKHSGKCLEVYNASMEDNAMVNQSVYSGLSNQIWILEPVRDVIPEQSEIADYGISVVDLNKTLIPLTPIWDYGVVPAFNGKMYYPASTPLNLSADIKLLWKVYGRSDTALKALTADNGQMVSANNTGGAVIANGSEIGDWETFEWVDLGPDRVALKAHNGKYIGFEKRYYQAPSSGWGIDMLVPDEKPYFRLVANSTSIGENETFEVVEVSTNKIALKAKNELYVSTNFAYDNPGRLTASATVIGEAETFTMVDLGYKSDPLPLVSYYEDFMFTGFNIQENYGSSIACFYDTDINQTIKTGFVMAYEFLRSQNDLSDMPTIIQSRNITINSTVDNTLAHQNEAIFKLMSEMLPQALYELRNQSSNATLPIIVAMEDYFTSKTMDEITSSLFIQGFNISIDITDSPVVTSKLFKMNWYDITNISLLNTEGVLLEAMRWGLGKGFNETDDALLVMMGLLNTWNSGEFTVTNVGEEEINFNIAESPELLAIIQYSVFSISSIMDIATLITKFNKLAAYRFLVFSAKCIKQLITPLANAIKTGLKVLKLSKVALKALTALRLFGRAIKSSKAVKSVIKIFKSTRFVSFLDKLGTLLILIDLAITGVIAFYMFWSILFESGFSDFGAALGAWVVIFSFAYAGLYILLALTLPVIGLILAILDMIFDFFGKLLEWFLDLVTKTEIRSKIGLGFVGTPTLETHDYDNNGFDVGDRIEFLARIYGKVWKTSDGYWGDVCDSYVNPSLTLSVPEGSDSGSFKNKVSTVTDGSTFRNETYDTGIWVDPISMSNFPLTIQLAYSYKIYYDQCTWFFGWWCDRESDSGTVTTDITTLYFDVFPGNLSAFLYWNELTPLDSDGDGLSDKEELSSASNPWRVDTDGDGLWDKYEVDRGILPFKSDSDGDGLNDGLEIRLDTETNNTDSDEDGLTDYEEYRGWLVDFNFYGNPFSMHVSPDPLKNDTDNDGLSDLEEFMKGLNPRSNDTDANGILDPDEILFSYQGLIQEVDFNGQGSSIRVMPNSTINTDVAFRVIGIECPATAQPANCSITVTLEDNILGNVSINQTIFQGTPSLYNRTEDIVNFSFNASENEGIYILKYYVNWSCFGIVPSSDQREIIGIIDVNISGNGSSLWECYDISGGDTDGDAISNINENIGWQVNYTDSSGTHTIHVTSDPRLIDTDSDGELDVWEHNCFENSTNPRDPDTDNDGLSDWEEKYRYKTNPLNYDTDGDGLDDQNELTFKSNPFESDSDLDGLTDLEEFILNSNPNDPDTDNDGLTDLEEFLFNSSLFLPDTDYDTLFDKMEYNLTTDPRDPDTDDDGLIDGYEVLVGTNPKQADTDDDGLIDGDEIYWGTNATYSDTDDDGLIDGDEIKYGTHPFISDTDRDGIKDFDDIDTYTPHVNNIILAYDLNEDVLEFTEHLETYTNVTIVSEEELLVDPTYKNSPYLVLVGRLDAGNETVGNITKNILENTGENTTQMLDSGHDFFAVKYGIWNKTQTVVMLSHPYRLDHLVVLNILKSMWKSVNGSSVEIQFPTPRRSFRIDAIQEIDTQIWVELNESITPWMKITKYNTSTTPNGVTHTLGLGSNHKALGLYIEINVSEDIQNETSNIIDDAWIILYYTASDLDRTGDGDGDDVGDIKESSLKFYFYHEDTGKWKALSKNMDWVYETGVDTTNVELYGKNYEGYIWAHVSHFSLYGVAGEVKSPDYPPMKNSPPMADASASEQFGFVNSPVIFDGSQSTDDGTIISYVWYFGDGTKGSGQQTTHIYSEAGTYTVTLIVADNGGATDTDIIVVTIAIANNPPTTPIIDGSNFGNINTEYNYIIVSMDLDNDSIRYIVEWGDGESDMSLFFGNNTLVTMSHSWDTAGVYRVTIYSEDENNALSGTAILTVFIDVIAKPIEDVIEGYLVDNNNDGIYDFFYDNVTGEERNVEKQSDGTYLIDSDGDGNWDYIYDIETKSLIKFTDPTLDYLPLIIVAILVMLLLSVVLLLIKRDKDRKKEQEKQKSTKKKQQTRKKNTSKKPRK